MSPFQRRPVYPLPETPVERAERLLFRASDDEWPAVFQMLCREAAAMDRADRSGVANAIYPMVAEHYGIDEQFAGRTVDRLVSAYLKVRQEVDDDAVGPVQ